MFKVLQAAHVCSFAHLLDFCAQLINGQANKWMIIINLSKRRRLVAVTFTADNKWTCRRCCFCSCWPLAGGRLVRSGKLGELNEQLLSPVHTWALTWLSFGLNWVINEHTNCAARFRFEFTLCVCVCVLAQVEQVNLCVFVGGESGATCCVRVAGAGARLDCSVWLAPQAANHQLPTHKWWARRESSLLLIHTANNNTQSFFVLTHALILDAKTKSHSSSFLPAFFSFRTRTQRREKRAFFAWMRSFLHLYNSIKSTAKKYLREKSSERLRKRFKQKHDESERVFFLLPKSRWEKKSQKRENWIQVSSELCMDSSLRA